MLCAGGLLVGTAPEASASCAAPPPVSPLVFTGTVVSTERDGLVAKVRTDDGRRVEVVGTPSTTGMTSVDRTFEVGARYEFHPLNETSPFQDNACTDTHVIAAPTTTAKATPDAARRQPASGDGPSGAGTVAAIGGTGAAIVLVAALVIWRRRNARSE